MEGGVIALDAKLIPGFQQIANSCKMEGELMVVLSVLGVFKEVHADVDSPRIFSVVSIAFGLACTSHSATITSVAVHFVQVSVSPTYHAHHARAKPIHPRCHEFLVDCWTPDA
eukprot:3025821-Amphidinium_carterae.1